MEQNKEQTAVVMTAEEAAQFAAFKAEKAKKEAAEKAKIDRETYSKMVDDEVTAAIPVLQELSKDIASVKNTVLDNFKAILQMKDEVLKRVKSDQKSHTFTTSDGLAAQVTSRLQKHSSCASWPTN